MLARVFQGSTDSTVFEDYIEQLLPLMGTYPEMESALVMDNASIHHTERVSTNHQPWTVRKKIDLFDSYLYKKTLNGFW